MSTRTRQPAATTMPCSRHGHPITTRSRRIRSGQVRAQTRSRCVAPLLPNLKQQEPGGLTPFVLPFSSTQCQPGQLCVGEEVRRNKPTFDFIKDNKLYTRDGLRAYTKAITFPSDSIEVKANWVPASQLAQFLAGSGSPSNPSL